MPNNEIYCLNWNYYFQNKYSNFVIEKEKNVLTYHPFINYEQKKNILYLIQNNLTIEHKEFNNVLKEIVKNECFLNDIKKYFNIYFVAKSNKIYTVLLE